ncbi:MAG: metallopeptidase TldD-related protein, partial [Planctomycetota bacterium]|nr:metallopeptidase TldD-related protein [Planctomycetota bacterium]
MRCREALAILERVLSLVRADAAIAALRGSEEQSLRLADNCFTDNVARTSLQIHLEVAFGDRRGAASTAHGDERSLRWLVERAEAAARCAPPDPEYLPPLGPAEMARYAAPLAAEPPALPDIAGRGAELVAAASQAAADGIRLSGALCDRTTWIAVATSAGLRAYHAAALSEMHATAIAGDGTGWAQKISSAAAEVSPRAVAERARQIAVQARQPREIAPEPLPLIMSPAAVAELLMFLFWAGFDGKAADEGRTFLRGCLGQKVFAECFTLRSPPAGPRCPGWPFQSDGLAAPAVAWVERGTVK